MKSIIATQEQLAKLPECMFCDGDIKNKAECICVKSDCKESSK
jgi:hypothetical protein